MLGPALPSFCSLDAAYGGGKVFEERLAGLRKVHICSALLSVFKISQAPTTQEAEEYGGQEGWGGRKAVWFSLDSTELKTGVYLGVF